MKIEVSNFSLDEIADSGQCFRWEGAGGKYLIPAFGREIRVSQFGSILTADCTEAEWESVWADYFDLRCDYGAYIASVDASDEYLSAAVRAGTGMRILRQELWEVLVSFIVSQNNNIPRIKSTLRKLCDMFGGFPSPQQLAEADVGALHQIGLGYRDAYLPAAARRFIADGLCGGISKRTYEEDRKYLMSYLGIGPKVADCVCLFGLYHKEAFPIDTWVKKILREHYSGAFPIERYPESAGVMQQYMFFYERTIAKTSDKPSSVKTRSAAEPA
ncbi:MAG: DNA glycosylase [Eubacteriales bacterium]|nr:DNA glycosylase [Eubacteriales bacterium]MDD3881680.1 DNA glycosylase [Eubacteriales bacterium]MDD4512261.1 DNA glycosylase [Eubacteriales bacterium]